MPDAARIRTRAAGLDATPAEVGAWVWLFPVTYVAHASEEYWANGGFINWLASVSGIVVARELFAVAAVIGLIVIAAAAYLARARGNRMLVIALTSFILTNGLVHVVGTAMTRSYSPGLISSVLIWLPLGVVAMRRAQIVSRHDVGALMLGPALHAIGAVVVMRVSVMSGGV
jgi:hypothetical protein